MRGRGRRGRRRGRPLDRALQTPKRSRSSRRDSSSRKNQGEEGEKEGTMREEAVVVVVVFGCAVGGLPASLIAERQGGADRPSQSTPELVRDVLDHDSGSLVRFRVGVFVELQRYAKLIVLLADLSVATALSCTRATNQSFLFPRLKILSLGAVSNCRKWWCWWRRSVVWLLDSFFWDSPTGKMIRGEEWPYGKGRRSIGSKYLVKGGSGGGGGRGGGNEAEYSNGGALGFSIERG
ncbi:hypothetical protein B296_00010860 [Ensete ventricosum]|uniref:Uncharacterized protein n=1 Tax=Ensete ventricosum TaxID=4639 RepID=A0A427AL64_ENSVE|nr:hypothetical protein B296_00010860 [Ensete ventricosum]